MRRSHPFSHAVSLPFAALAFSLLVAGCAHKPDAHGAASHEEHAEDPHAAHGEDPHAAHAEHPHAAHGEDPHAAHAGELPAPSPTGANPVQVEMRLLTVALQVAVQAIADGDVRPVAHALHQVHLAKDATSAALTGGSYVPPKNGQNLKRFIELDEAFHGELESLVRASSANDLGGTARALGSALAQCNGCHTEFRFK